MEGYLAKCSFAVPLAANSALLAEILATTIAVQHAFENMARVWLVFCCALRCTRQQWLTCLNLIDNMEFLVLHIYKEGNEIADAIGCHWRES